MSHALEPSINAFIDYLHSARGYSVLTCQTYQRQLNACADVLHQQGLSNWQGLTSRAIESLLISWRRNEVGIATINQRLAALRSFAEFLLRQGVLSSNPAKLVKAPKAPRRLPKNMDVDGVAHLLDETPTDSLGIRDRAMFELIYSSGLRVSELVAVNVSDLNASRELRVTGKGQKTRIVPYGREAERWLNAWLQVRSQWLVTPSVAAKASHQGLFISQRGGRLTARSVQLRLRDWAQRRGMPEHVHPHKLRHSFASHVLESSGDLRAVQELLGHANLSTTQVYTHLDFQHLAKVYDTAHPRARKNRKPEK